MTELKKNIINGIIDVEGGYVDDPADSGGKTKYGITKRTARFYGFKGKMKNLTRDYAFMIYAKLYWDQLRLDDIEALSKRIAEELADTGVNLGPGMSARFLQRSLNVLNRNELYYKDLKVDGQIGRQTLWALKSFFIHRASEGEMVLYRMLNSLQGAHYVVLAENREKDEKFIFGWFRNRVD